MVVLNADYLPLDGVAAAMQHSHEEQSQLLSYCNDARHPAISAAGTVRTAFDNRQYVVGSSSCHAFANEVGDDVANAKCKVLNSPFEVPQSFASE